MTSPVDSETIRTKTKISNQFCQIIQTTPKHQTQVPTYTTGSLKQNGNVQYRKWAIELYVSTGS